MSLKKVDGPDDLMTATDAGRILGVSVDMVRVLARNGGLPFMSTIGGVRLFRRADVDALARARAQRKQSQLKLKVKLRRVR
jgi:excisionase family DNA binding protein